MELSNFIQVMDTDVDKKVIGNFIKFLNAKANFEDATILKSGKKFNAVDKTVRSTKAFSLSKENESLSVVHWYNFWHNVIKNYHLKYQQLTNTQTGASIIKTMDALKYEVGDFYVSHVDHHITFPRNLSIIFFLNDEYQGGEIFFQTPDKKEDIIKVEPQSGRLIMWPSNFLYPHRVGEVRKGTRFVIVSWML
jgi:predicted 2-oxoglutarate/Fe(II)-dependent dioxygenase YbiX